MDMIELYEKIKKYKRNELEYLYFSSLFRIASMQSKIDKIIEIIENYNLGKFDYSIPTTGIIELLETLKEEYK